MRYSANLPSLGLALEDMDRLFMQSMHRTVWSQITRKDQPGRGVVDDQLRKESIEDEKENPLAHIELGEHRSK